MADTEASIDRALTLARVIVVVIASAALVVTLVTQPLTPERVPLLLPGVLAIGLLAMFDLDRSSALGPAKSARELPRLRDEPARIPGAPRTAKQWRRRRNGAYLNGAVAAFLGAFAFAAGEPVIGAAIACITVVFLLLGLRAGWMLDHPATDAADPAAKS